MQVDEKQNLEFRAEMRQIAKEFNQRQWVCIGFILAFIISGTLMQFLDEK